MNGFIRLSAVALCASLVTLAPLDARTRKPTGAVLCLGSTNPRPCGVITEQSSIAFRADSDYQGTAILRFRPRPVELEATPIDLPLSAGPLKRGKTYRIVAPFRQMCATAARGQTLQFEIQVLTSDLQQSQAAGEADSIGVFQMRC